MPAKKSKDDGGSGYQYGPGDIVMAKVKGYPAWPGVICDEKNVPSKVRSQKNIKGGFTVRFFPHADYHWFKPRDLSLLTKREIRAYLDDPHKKQADLRSAYSVALEPDEWIAQQDAIVHAAEKARQEEEEAQDELEGDDDDAAATGAKRKRADSTKGGKVRESAQEKAKKKKKLDSASALKAKATKADADSPAPSAGRKSAAAGEEDEDPELKMVRSWRHALQRGFLGKDGRINPDEVANYDRTFKAVEEHKKITNEALIQTKIGKVMKRIAILSDVPSNDQYKFTERASALCQAWGEVLSGAAASGAAAGAGAGGATAQPTKSESAAPASEKEAKDAPSQDVAAAAAAAANGSDSKADTPNKSEAANGSSAPAPATDAPEATAAAAAAVPEAAAPAQDA